MKNATHLGSHHYIGWRYTAQLAVCRTQAGRYSAAFCIMTMSPTPISSLDCEM